MFEEQLHGLVSESNPPFPGDLSTRCVVASNPSHKIPSRQSSVPELRTHPPADSPGGLHSSGFTHGFSFKCVISGWSLLLLALAACWLLFFNAVRGEWELNPQYNYGYVVPLLGLALFWRRWPGRPPSSFPGHPVAPAILAASLLLLFLPLSLVLEANPEWRLLYWVQGRPGGGFELLPPLLARRLALDKLFRPAHSIYADSHTLAHDLGKRHYSGTHAFRCRDYG